MRRLVVLAATLPLSLAAAPARWQDALTTNTTRDEWFACLCGKQKVGWAHERIEESLGAPTGATAFVVLGESVRLTADGECHREDRTETDSSGRVLRFERTITTPWGRTRAIAQPGTDGGLRYRVEVRDQPAVEGTLEECWDGSVLELLVLRGAQPTGKRTVRFLSLPGEGTEERDLDVEREGDGWTIKGKDFVASRSREGAFVRSEDPDRPDEVVLAATEVDARDRAVTAGDRSEALEQVSHGVLSVRRPGPDWSLARREHNGAAMIGAEHPCGVGVTAFVMPMRLPVDERERLRMAETMRAGWNKERERKPTREGPDLGPPAVTTWHGLPAVSFPLGGQIAQVAVEGEAYLVGLRDGSSAMVMIGGPKDLAESRAAALEMARDTLGFVAAEVPWERITLGNASLEVPRGWKRLGQQPCMRSALGGSQVRVNTDRLPTGLDLRAVQDLWARNQRDNPAFAAIEVERRADDASVGGHSSFLTVMRGKLPESKGVTPAVRCASCAILRKDGTFVEVVLVALDLDFELEAIERMLGSIQWIEEE